jgi:hypothetical protein
MTKKKGSVFNIIIGLLILLGSTIIFSAALGAADIPETAVIKALEKAYGPVKFTHARHMERATDCALCHHHQKEGDMASCVKCHRARFDPKAAKQTPLKAAYHERCLGCHDRLAKGPRGCVDCHPATHGKDAQKAAKYSQLGNIARIYEPVNFSHGDHMWITDSCTSCHHHEAAGKYSSCKSCHDKPFNPAELDKPGLKGAYHRRCLDCHKESAKAGPLGCNECHPPSKESKNLVEGTHNRENK